MHSVDYGFRHLSFFYSYENYTVNRGIDTCFYLFIFSLCTFDVRLRVINEPSF